MTFSWLIYVPHIITLCLGAGNFHPLRIIINQNKFCRHCGGGYCCWRKYFILIFITVFLQFKHYPRTSFLLYCCSPQFCFIFSVDFPTNYMFSVYSVNIYHANLGLCLSVCWFPCCIYYAIGSLIWYTNNWFESI